VLIGGSCNKTQTKVDWIASRDSTLQQRFNDLVPPASSSEGSETKMVKPETGLLDYAVVILSSPGKHTVEVPEGFHEGVDFFKGHHEGIEVAFGLNVYAVLNLPALKAWQFFQALDYPERQVTLQGFVGWDPEWSLGVALGDEAGVDVSNEKKFLVLRADLPERKPRPGAKHPWYQSMRLGFEFSVGDSTGISRNDKALSVKNSFDVVGKLIHTIVINQQLTLEGTVGFDRATEGSKGLFGKAINLVQSYREAACPLHTETSTDLVVSYAAQTDVPLGTNLTWEGLKADFKLTQKRDKFVVALSSSLGIGGRPGVIKLGGSMEQQIDKETSKKDVKVLEAEQNQLKKDLAAARLGLEDAKKEWKEATGAKKAVSYDAYCAESAKVTKLSQDLETMTKDARTWRFRASAGHMSFGELLASLQDLAAWIAQR
jgi:outer membrane murein-binding lipoprotein Lpp